VEKSRPAASKPRRQRRDAEENRERVLAAAAPVILRDGAKVSMAAIAASAGVGVATLYRSFPDRDALLDALQFRAYHHLNAILDAIDLADLSGLASVGEYLTRALEISDLLVLPLHGAPPLVSPEAAQARQTINDRLERYIARGRAERSIGSPINATDIIAFSALITHPLSHGPNWPTMAARQVTNFLNGVASSGPIELPGPTITQTDVERAFARTANEGRPRRPITPQAASRSSIA
jgi:AcrR family transcriptional regulator